MFHSLLRFFVFFQILAPAAHASSGHLSSRKPIEFRIRPIDPKSAYSIFLTPKGQTAQSATPKQTEEMLRTLREVEEMFGRAFEMPKELSLTPYRFATNAFFDGDMMTMLAGNPTEEALALPYQTLVPNKKKKLQAIHPAYSKGIWVHELGHAIFELNLSRIAPKYSESLASMRAYGKQYRADFTAAQQLSKDAPYSEISELWTEFYRDHPTDMKIIKELQGLVSLAMPYHELFADLVAVLWSQDPQIVRDGIFRSGRSRVNLQALDRDFESIPTPFKTWTKSEAHVALTPTRRHIWRQYLSGPRIRTMDRPLFLQILARAIGSELDANLSRLKEGMPALTPDQLNADLIRAIDLEFR